MENGAAVKYPEETSEILQQFFFTLYEVRKRRRTDGEGEKREPPICRCKGAKAEAADPQETHYPLCHRHCCIYPGNGNRMAVKGTTIRKAIDLSAIKAPEWIDQQF